MTVREFAQEVGIHYRTAARITGIYEKVFGPLPLEEKAKVLTPEALDRMRLALEAVRRGRVPSYELAFRAQLGQVEAVPASKMDMALELLTGIKRDVQALRVQIEALADRIEALEKRGRTS